MLDVVALVVDLPRGYYSEPIIKVAANPSMSLREQASWTFGYSINADGSRTSQVTSSQAEVFPYQPDLQNKAIVLVE